MAGAARDDKSIKLKLASPETLVFKSTVVIAAVLGFSSVAFADEAVKSGGTAKAGRAVDDGSVKAAGAADKPGRAVEDGTVKSPSKPKMHSRAVDHGKVKSAGKTDKSRRAADEAKK